MRPFRISFSLMVLLLGIQQARAENTNIVQTAQSEPRIYGGKTINVIGITPGMGVGQVTAILTKAYGLAPVVTSSSLGMQFKSIQMGSQQYVSQLTDVKSGRVTNGGQTPTDEIEVDFGTPSTGNTVVGIGRTLSFDDPKSAPTLTAIQADLAAKYGSPSQTQAVNQPFSTSPQEVHELWSFNTKTQNQCYTKCPSAASPSFNPSMESEYQQSVAKGEVFLLSANITLQQSDTSRVDTLIVFVDDEGNKWLTASEALKQLTAAAAADYKKSATPTAAPNL